jgi:mannose-6-phosphate isomerase-like protein (cupin superfamily)
MQGHDIRIHPVHLGTGASADIEPLFTGAMEWYADYADRHARDGAEGRLMSMHSFNAPWGVWEMHPQGSEVVLCTSGQMIVHQEEPDGTTSAVTLGPGQYVINEPGVWHTADVNGEATAVFVTAGLGTQHRPR